MRDKTPKKVVIKKDYYYNKGRKAEKDAECPYQGWKAVSWRAGYFSTHKTMKNFIHERFR